MLNPMPATSDQSAFLALQRENEHLQRAVHELSVLNDLATAIGGSLGSAAIMQTIIDQSLKAVNGEQGTITLVSHDDSTQTFVRAMASSADIGDLHINQPLLGWMQLNKQPLVVTDPANDSRFRDVQWSPGIRSIFCVPLTVKSKLTGILTIYNSMKLEKEDQRLLAIIASQSAQILENARLHEQENAYIRMQEQVRLAGEIQRRFLPDSIPVIEGYELTGVNHQAQMVGGDYFDFIPGPDTMAICLGDVSGKGLPASMLLGFLQATMRLVTMLEPAPDVAMKRANQLLTRSTSPSKFVTLFLSILDWRSHRLSFCNAGHCPPLLVSGTDCRRLETRGIVLGVVDTHEYAADSVELRVGDVVVMYSDGVSEALSELDEELGEQSILRVVTEHREKPASVIQGAVIDAVRAHAGSATQSDDITLVVIKRTA
jgi:phosphoserine phosphatase RsbU/P